jgi:type I restriction enzyme S subunit
MKWPSVTLGNLAIDMQPGFAQQPDGDDRGLPHLRTNNVSEDGSIDLSSVKTVTPSAEQRDKYSLQPFDILFNNTNSPALVGKTALFTQDGEFLFSNHMTRIRVHTNLANPAYVARYLHWVWRTGGFRGMVTQWVSQAAINRTQLAKLQVPLTPLSEQRRIVEILDQADALRRKRAEADAKAARILPALFYQMFGDPANWARQFPSQPLRQLVEVISGATPAKSEPGFWNGSIPWVSPKDMKHDYIYDSIDHVTPEAISASGLKLVPPRTVLIVVRGMILSHTVPIAIAGTALTINQDMKALVPMDQRISPEYLHGALKALRPLLLARVRTAAHGTRKLDTDDLLSMSVAIPDEDQHALYLRKRATSRCASEGIAATCLKLDRLFEVVLHRAFSGDLTAKWREAHMKELLQEMEQQAGALTLIRKYLARGTA